MRSDTTCRREWPLVVPPSGGFPCGFPAKAGTTNACHVLRASGRTLIPNPQSIIPNPQSIIPNPQSPIPNPQSPIPPSLPRARRRTARGMVLIIVIVVIFMISLAGLSFVTVMNTEYKAVQLDGDMLQLEQIAGSGEEFLKLFLDRPRRDQDQAGGTWDNPGQFRDVPACDDPQVRRRGRFTFLSPRTVEDSSDGVRFGLEDESGRLNLGVLLAWDAERPGQGREALLKLPGMTESIADAILDWIDPDSKSAAVRRRGGLLSRHRSPLRAPQRRAAVPGGIALDPRRKPGSSPRSRWPSQPAVGRWDVADRRRTSLDGHGAVRSSLGLVAYGAKHRTEPELCGRTADQRERSEPGRALQSAGPAF